MKRMMMRTRTIGFLVLTALFSGGCLCSLYAAQSAPGGLRGPVVGYVFDARAQAIRPINGIPGSSVLGESLSFPFPIAGAAFSRDGEFALGIAAAGTPAVNLLRSIGAANQVLPVEGAIDGADGVVLNGDGSAAVLFASATRQFQIVRGLPESPVAGPAIDFSPVSGTISTFAINQSGSSVLIAVSADHGALYLATDDQNPPRSLGSFGSPSALTFVNGDKDVIVADTAVNELTLIRNFASEPESVRLAGERDGISAPAGLQISPDGHKLYIADRGSRTLKVWNFDSQSIEASYPLDAEPTRLTPLRGSSMFVLNDVGDHPLLLLDTQNAAAYFVPAEGGRN